MTKREIMYAAHAKNVRIVATEGKVFTGVVIAYETPYDNDCDESSILVMSNEEGGVGFYESDIDTIEIVEE